MFLNITLRRCVEQEAKLHAFVISGLGGDNFFLIIKRHVGA